MENIKIFGFELSRPKSQQNIAQSQQSFIPPDNADGAITIAGSPHYSTYVDLDGTSKNEIELITRYREMAMQPEIESAIDDIVNEAIVEDDDGKTINLILDNLKDVTPKIKKQILEEFQTVLRLLNYQNMAQEIFRRWYVDGRIHYQIMLDKNNPSSGIQELRYVDPRKIKKVRELKKHKDANTNADVVTVANEYYVYNDKIMSSGSAGQSNLPGVKITKDSIVTVNSGLMDARRATVLSYLHKAIKPLNQLRMIEDATVIYRVCLTAGTRVKTNMGWKYIKDVIPGDKVYSFSTKGLHETLVTKQWETGTKQTYRVSSTHHEIIGTDNHPILVLNLKTNEVEYVDIKDIQPKKHCFVFEKPVDSNLLLPFPDISRRLVWKLNNGKLFINLKITGKEKLILEIADSLGLKSTKVRNFLYGMQHLPKEQAEAIIKLLPIDYNTVTFSEKYEGFWQNKCYLPKFLDEEFARFFGFMLGDGSVSKHTITFAEGVDETQNKFYSDIMKKYFGNSKRYSCKGRKYTGYTSSNTLGCEIMKELGFVTGAKNKRAPGWVFQSKDSVKFAFVQGLLDADAHIRNLKGTGLWTAGLSLCNQGLVEDTKELWTSLGLTSGHITRSFTKGTFRAVGNETEPRQLPDTESWNLNLSDLKLPMFEKIRSVKAHSIEPVYELEVEHEKHNFIANGVVVHNSRAPERRIFYIDVGNLPKLKAEQYLNDIMTKYKNKLVYDSATGQVRDDRKSLSMLEDFWLPRREGGKGTEITTLSGGANLGVMEDVIYFEKKLYKSLSVPVGRLDPQEGFSMGKTDEISRDEVKFDKFIQRLRSRFSDMFDQILRVQLTTKGICTLDEWEIWKEKLYFDFIHDNYFSELKEAEIIKERLSVVALIDPYTGRYFSNNWVRKNVLRMDDDEIAEMKKEIKQEMKEDEILMGLQGDPNAQQDPDENPGGQAPQKEDIHPDDKAVNKQVSGFNA